MTIIKYMLNTVFVVSVLVSIWLLAFHSDWIMAPPFESRSFALSCRNGTYSIGEVCKAEPTGCPDGDSVPLELCEKFKPIPTPPVDYVTEPSVTNWSAEK